MMTPESSMELQHAIGADIHMAFDELTAPLAARGTIVKAMQRTHTWAERCLVRHDELNAEHLARGENLQALYGVVQGARDETLRRQSANFLGQRNFDGYGIGGVFQPGEIADVVRWVCETLPEDKPRHLLGLGSQPADLFLGVEYGIDTFDCVAPTRQARNGALYTFDGPSTSAMLAFARTSRRSTLNATVILASIIRALTSIICFAPTRFSALRSPAFIMNAS